MADAYSKHGSPGKPQPDPNDRLSISIFERDYNFTVASYEKVFPIFTPTPATV